MPSRARHFLLAVTTAATAVASTGMARAAEERPVLFSLSMAESPLDQCGGTKALEGAVEERLHRVTFTGQETSDITLAIASDAPAESKTWRAHIVERDREGTELGQREVPLPVDDCHKALDTLAVVLAITIGPSRTTSEPSRQIEPVQAEPEPPPPLGDRPPRRTKPARRPEPLRWTAAPLAGIAFGTGMLPKSSWGVEVGVIVRPPVARLSLIARAAYWPERSTPTIPPADIDRTAGAILGCWDLVRSEELSWLGCGGADVSRIAASSPGLTKASDQSVTFAALGETRLGYRFPLQDRIVLEPFLAPQVSVLLVRDRFIYRDTIGRERTLLFPAPVALQATIGVAVHFL